MNKKTAKDKKGSYFNEDPRVRELIQDLSKQKPENVTHWFPKYINDMAIMIGNYEKMLDSFRMTASEHNEMSLAIRCLENKIRDIVPFIAHLKHYSLCQACCQHRCLNCEADRVWDEHQLDKYETRPLFKKKLK